MDKAKWQGYGIDCDGGLRTCMNNPAFYRKILTMFLEDDCFARAAKAYETEDQSGLFACMHELKGTSGNTALTALYEASSQLAELLRHGCDDTAQVDALFAAVTVAYETACQGITLLLAEE